MAIIFILYLVYLNNIKEGIQPINNERNSAINVGTIATINGYNMTILNVIMC